MIYPLREVAPEVSPGVVYLLAVLLVAMYWGLAFGLLTSVASGGRVQLLPYPADRPPGDRRFGALGGAGVFLVAAAVASVVADLARTRAVEAERRRGEADLAADTARVLLGGATLVDALPEAGALVEAALGMSGVEIVLDPDRDAAEQRGVVLDLGSGRDGAPRPGRRCG